MDDAKKRELEELRKQIDPDVLARVAAAMGENVPGNAPGAGAGAEAPAKPAGKSRKPAPSKASLSDLKARIRRREKEIDTPGETEKETVKQASFLIYDPSHFRAKQLGAFIQRLGFPDVTVASDPQTFVRSLIMSLNNPLMMRAVMVVYSDLYDGLKALLESEAIQQVRKKLPRIDESPVLVVFDAKQTPTPPDDLDPKYVLTMRHSIEFNTKRLHKALDLPL